MNLEETKIMIEGLKLALRDEKGLRFVILEGKYAECLVAKKLIENGFTVEFSRDQKYDLLVNGETRVEVKCGKLWDFGASASFGKGKQISEDRFDNCVFSIIDKDVLDAKHFFVFTKEELNECNTLRPKMTMKATPSILFFYKDLREFEEESARTGEPIFNIERQLFNHSELFDNAWNKIR